MRKTLLKTLGISTAAATLALFAYGASAQDMKKKEPAKKMAACTTLKDEAGCTGREDCTWTPAKGKAAAKAKTAKSTDAKTGEKKAAKPKAKAAAKPKTAAKAKKA